MRFFLGQTQLEIAEELGLTQMTISRNLTRILREIRQQIGELGDTVGFPQQASRRAG
jgi:RNA polymerase sigma-B factor